MPKKTLRKCSGCHTLIEVCDKTPPTARRFCSECMLKKLADGCAICGAYKGQHVYLHWFQGDYCCSRHLNPGYGNGEPRLRRCSSLGMNVA